jgi:hypothetical protein
MSAYNSSISSEDFSKSPTFQTALPRDTSLDLNNLRWDPPEISESFFQKSKESNADVNMFQEIMKQITAGPSVQTLQLQKNEHTIEGENV